MDTMDHPDTPEAPPGEKEEKTWREEVSAMQEKIGQTALLRVPLSPGDKRDGIDIPVVITEIKVVWGNIRAVVKTAFEPEQFFSLNVNRLTFTP